MIRGDFYRWNDRYKCIPPITIGVYTTEYPSLGKMIDAWIDLTVEDQKAFKKIIEDL